MAQVAGKIFLVLLAGCVAFLVVWLGLFKRTPTFDIPSAVGALTGAAVGLGGLRMILLAGEDSPWLVLPVFLVIMCVGLFAGMCVANAFAPAIPARYEDWGVGLGLCSLFWAVYGVVGAFAGCVMMYFVYLIRGAGIP